MSHASGRVTCRWSVSEHFATALLIRGLPPWGMAYQVVFGPSLVSGPSSALRLAPSRSVLIRLRWQLRSVAKLPPADAGAEPLTMQLGPPGFCSTVLCRRSTAPLPELATPTELFSSVTLLRFAKALLRIPPPTGAWFAAMVESWISVYPPSVGSGPESL